MNNNRHSPLSALILLDERAKATQREIKDATGKIIRQVAREGKAMNYANINACLDAHFAKVFDAREARMSKQEDEPEMVIQNATHEGRQPCPGKCHGNGTYYRPGALNPDSGMHEPGEDVNCDTCQAKGWIEK